VPMAPDMAPSARLPTANNASTSPFALWKRHVLTQESAG